MKGKQKMAYVGLDASKDMRSYSLVKMDRVSF